MPSKLDEAFQRYRFLRKIAEERATRAVSGPVAAVGIYPDLGIIQTGDKIANARKRVADFHDTLSKAIDQLGFLEIVAAFEAEMGNRIGNAIGTVRGAVKSGFSTTDALAKHAEGFVREKKSFESIKAIEDLIAQHLSTEPSKALGEIRIERNRLAHGASEQAVRVTPERAYTVLTAVLSETGSLDDRG